MDKDKRAAIILDSDEEENKTKIKNKTECKVDRKTQSLVEKQTDENL